MNFAEYLEKTGVPNLRRTTRDIVRQIGGRTCLLSRTLHCPPFLERNEDSHQQEWEGEAFRIGTLRHGQWMASRLTL